jgi:hypothetical protein
VKLTAFVLGGRPGAFFFLLVIATGLLLFSTSEKKQHPHQMKKHILCVTRKKQKNGLDSKN